MEVGSSSNISRDVEIQEEFEYGYHDEYYTNTDPYPQDQNQNTYPYYPEDEYPNTYPYPSDLSALSFVSVRLSGRDNYRMWRAQMQCLLESHDMHGFINGSLKLPPIATTRVSGNEKVDDYHQRLWRRSDAVVKGWILGSLSEQTLSYVLDRVHQPEGNAYIPAKDVWDQLKNIYGPLDLTPPALVPPHCQTPPKSSVYLQQSPAHRTLFLREPNEEERADRRQNLHKATLGQHFDWTAEILDEGGVTVIDQISNNGNTALHVAVNNTKFLELLLERVPPNTELLDVRNSDGSTLLHVAAIVNNPTAAAILLSKSPGLLVSKDNKDHTPLFIALSNMHLETAECLLEHDKNDLLFGDGGGEEILVALICAKGFRTAYDILMYSFSRGSQSDAVLMSVVQNYPCKELNKWEAFIENDMILKRGIVYRGRQFLLGTVGTCMVDSDRCASVLCAPVGGGFIYVQIIIMLFLHGIIDIIMFFPYILKKLGYLFVKKQLQTHSDAQKLLGMVCYNIKMARDTHTYHNYYTNPILEATTLNLPQVIQKIVSYFPNAISSVNQDGHNIVQYAVISRSEKVYNLINQMTEHKNVYRTIKDSSDNNLLHLAGRLAPANKLKLISGAALQVQRELQWFKEVERFVCQLNIMQKNCFGETPQMVFTREHKDLVIEGEKWLKATAESYTITAALIITIVFAAAITVPGGNKDTGIPIFTKETAFGIFAISDAISLFAAVTSLLMFLSILTARFAEQDFLFKLPTKLIIGLATLFISTTSMIIAFGATLYLVFGQSNSRILIPIAVLTCLPITCFVTLQFPLVVDLVSATYGRSIFGKNRYQDDEDNIFH